MTTQPTGSQGLSKQAYTTAAQNMPWRKDVAWWVVLIQGIVLTLLGLYVLTQDERASFIIVLVAGFMLLVDGALAGINGMRGRVAAGRAEP